MKWERWYDGHGPVKHIIIDPISGSKYDWPQTDLLLPGPVVQAHLVVQIQPRASCGPHLSTGGLCTNQLSHRLGVGPWRAKAPVAESCAVDLRSVHRSFRFCSATERKPRTELAAGKTAVEKHLQHQRPAAATRKHFSVGILGLSPALYFERV